jgi:uncharacterized membrane protein
MLRQAAAAAAAAAVGVVLVVENREKGLLKQGTVAVAALVWQWETER